MRKKGFCCLVAILAYLLITNPAFAQSSKNITQKRTQTDTEIAVIEQKIKAGLIPYCVLPPECQSWTTACAEVLRQKRSTEQEPDLSQDFVQIAEGSFFHLLHSQAFTCDVGAQEGDTCSIYSGASLMSHYCATPARNPLAGGWCVSEGSGFSCVSAKQLLDEAYKAGIWESTICHEDSKNQQTECKPAVQNIHKYEELDLAAQSRQCDGTDPRAMDEYQQHYCEDVKQQLADIRQEGAHEISDIPSQDEAWLSGFSGINIETLSQIYQKHGFKIIKYKANEKGWQEITKSLEKGHPVQISMKSNTTNNPDDHVIVLEGKWTDKRGVERFLYRDSNYPSTIQVMKTEVLQAKYLDSNQTAIGLRTPR